MSLLLAASPVAQAAACPDPVPESEWSVIMPLAARSLVLDIARMGDAIVAVGARGHVLVSEDEGRSWTQKRTPTRAPLAGVYFHDRNLGWAVGHDAVILRTEDGGETWCRTHFAPDLERPLFDVWFEDADRGFAIGSYGYLLRSEDGGLSWREEPLLILDDDEPGAEDAESDDELDVDDWGDDDWSEDGPAADLHLNRIVHGPRGMLYIVAEAGVVFRSDDTGASWVALDPPYDGSFFGGVAPDDNTLLIFGLRGNMFRTWDDGATWRRSRHPVDSSLFGGTRLADGGVLVVGTAGVMLISREGDRFRLIQRGDRKALMGAIPTTDGAVVVIGEPGVQRLEQRALAE